MTKRKEAEQYLSRREQQIMDVVYRKERATAAEIEAGLHDAPSNSSVRTILRILESKGHLRHTFESGRFVYSPTCPRPNAARQALHQVVRTFFDGSMSQAVATLLSEKDRSLSEEELDDLARMIDEARSGGDR